MNFRVLVIGLTAVAVGGLFTSTRIQNHFEEARADLQREYRVRLQEKEGERTQRLFEARIRWTEELETRNRELLQERERTLGGPLEEILKNPDLSIGQMLLGIAAHYTPTGSRAQVRVERFTEFTIYLDLLPSVSAEARAQLCKDIIKDGLPYVSTLVLRRAGNVVGIIEREAIESVADWTNVPISTVAAMLGKSMAPEDSAWASAGNSVEKTRASTAPGSPEERAERLFMRQFKQAEEALSNAIKLQDEAVSLERLRIKEDLGPRRKQLETAGKLARQFVNFFQDALYIYEGLLQSEKLSNDYVQAAVRTREKAISPLLAKAPELAKAVL